MTARAALLVLCMAACTSPAPPPGAAGPAEAVQDFADAVRKGDTATAWSLVSSRAQAEADRLAAAAHPDAGAEAGRQMLFTGALPGRAVSAKLVSQSGDSAEVRASAGDGGAGRIFRVVREGGRWRIDLDLPR